MKKLLYLLLPLLALVSCSVETDSSGDLGGYWHLERVDTLATGGSADLSGLRRFWAVQGDLLQVSDKDGGGSYLLRYSHEGDSLTLSDPRSDSRTDGDPAISDPTLLQPFGILSLTDRYAIESLHGGSMVLVSSKLRLDFKRF